jgi:hypothetical protein
MAMIQNPFTDFRRPLMPITAPRPRKGKKKKKVKPTTANVLGIPLAARHAIPAIAAAIPGIQRGAANALGGAADWMAVQGKKVKKATPEQAAASRNIYRGLRGASAFLNRL